MDRNASCPCIPGCWCVGHGWHLHDGYDHERYLHWQRPGCRLVGGLGSFGCDYWREAMDGFVMGIGENERIARHKSVGHGDDTCLDILFAESFTLPRVVSTEDAPKATASPRFGEVPVELLEKLEPARKRLAALKVRLKLEGLSEGVLFYQLEPEAGVLCGAGGKLIQATFERDLHKAAPGLMARDVAPIAVYGGSS